MKSIVILLVVFCLVSCKDEVKTSEINSTENREITTDNGHNSRNSLDWTGVYEGVLPCENCDGIETSIQLNKNLDYVLSQHYLGKAEAEENNLNETGKFEWNKQGNTINLGERQKLYFKVSENYLLQVFKDESKVMGDSAMKYRLTKTNKL
ncbi:copper resistance protein NlpE [Salegentibacter sp. JZCK2]|uniref:copper resistance protein NlpE n=1 Tax=Salegentibacter tibetensis TaxID=2873600 RepID=UPI001CCF0FAC|nr:copper resistance protein NlpE [Salegentibacter tibetensis]MBZ9730817.1 copper resistance protein NlpE [Salegentibacter tibetensis]